LPYLKPFTYTLIFNLILLFLPLSIKSQTDTLICDNGGFESNFQYYKGVTAEYDGGSDNCTPTYFSVPVVWSPSSLSYFRRFEIVTSGVDTLVGINRTKFGSKAALINNRYGHLDSICHGDSDVNKIIKRFKVTEENREFTVWYAAILESPVGHTGTQPFFSIKCDRAPSNDLCFDASILNCEDEYRDTICSFDEIDVIDWSCHRIKIPKNMIDSIATLEITAADCGEDGHFGYAYIDGICEECEGSAMGSVTLYDNIYDASGFGVKYRSCEGDVITICGSYTLPTLCGTWDVDSIKAPGFTISNMDIDEEHETFCFDLLKEDFPEDSCRELYVIIYFSSNLSNFSQQLSNTIEICDDEFEEYAADVTTGICQNNGTAILLSDDYYYVSVDLSVNYGDFWTMERQLDDPPSGSSGEYVIKTGTGSGTIDLGPILIQEGNWDLTITIGGCILFYEITAPGFCGSCNPVRGTKISNITCINNPGNLNPLDDTWTFDLKVPGITGTYSFAGPGVSSTWSYGNTIHTITVGTIGVQCASYTITDISSTCTAKFVVCPPKPCSNECDLEAYVTDVVCEEEDEVEVFYADLYVSGAGSGYYCFQSFAVSDAGNTSNSSYHYGSVSNPLGPFYEDVYIIVYVCPSSACTCDQTCFQVIYIPKPDCENLEFHSKGTNDSKIKPMDELFVIPNPVNNNEIVLRSMMKSTSFELYNSAAKLIHYGSFTGPEYRYRSEISSGLYFVRYLNSEEKYRYIKVIKL